MVFTALILALIQSTDGSCTNVMKMLQWVDPITQLKCSSLDSCNHHRSGSFFLLRTILMTTSVLVSRATLEETVRWRLMSVCLVHVRMEEHVLTSLTGTTATAAVSFW